MSDFLKYVHDVKSDKVSVVALNDDEKNELDNLAKIYNDEKLQRQTEEENLWNLKINAYKKLGLTDQEIAILAPTPSFLLPPSTTKP